MRAHVWIGILLLIVGVVVLVVPRTDRRSVSVGGLSVGVETEKKDNIPLVAGGALILAGLGVMIGGQLRASPGK